MTAVIFVFVLNILFFVVVLINYFYAPKLKYTTFQQLFRYPKISILIPCRNEEANIKSLLNQLLPLNQDNIEILIYDDLSTDSTAKIILDYTMQNSRIQLIKGHEKPSSWIGKLYACHNLAKRATGEVYLFLDADVSISHHGVLQIVQEMIQKKCDLLTVFPSQKCVTLGERLVVPIMHRILLTLLPLSLIYKSSRPSLSAANGQLMCFLASTYEQYWFHEKFSRSVVDDISIVRYMKKQGLSVMCYLGTEVVQCRMYHNYHNSVEGFSKNVVHFFGGSYVLGVFYALGGIVSFLILYQAVGISFYLLALLVLHLSTEWFVASTSHAPRKDIFWIYPLRGVVLLHILWSSFYHKQNKTLQWKGRNIY